MDFLLGLPSKVKTLVDRLTSARAANLDNLDAAVSDTAPAATALSVATWSSARAQALDAKALSDTDPTTAPPIATSWQTPTNSGDSTAAATLAGRVGGGTYNTTSTSYVDALNVTGKGVLNFLAYASSGSAASGMIVTIDGIDIISGTGFATGGGALWHMVAGSIDGGLDQIPFRVSLRVQIKTTAAATAYAVWKYRRTA